MDFNAEKNVFKLDATDCGVLRLSPDTTEWPQGDTDALVDEIAKAEHDLVGQYPTTLPPAERARGIVEHVARGRRLAQMRRLVARHATLSETDFDQLLAG